MRKKVLVVDDDIHIAELLRLILKRANLDVTLLYHGLDAINYLGDEKPDIILLDISIPGFDGFEILKWIRQKLGDQTTPVIMLSGYASSQSKDKAFELGANDYVIKPFNLHALTQTIRSLTRQKRIQVDKSLPQPGLKLNLFDTPPPNYGL